jgi:hypothetical protein
MHYVYLNKKINSTTRFTVIAHPFICCSKVTNEDLHLLLMLRVFFRNGLHEGEGLENRPIVIRNLCQEEGYLEDV